MSAASKAGAFLDQGEKAFQVGKEHRRRAATRTQACACPHMHGGRHRRRPAGIGWRTRVAEPGDAGPGVLALILHPARQHLALQRERHVGHACGRLLPGGGGRPGIVPHMRAAARAGVQCTGPQKSRGSSAAGRTGNARPMRSHHSTPAHQAAEEQGKGVHQVVGSAVSHRQVRALQKGACSNGGGRLVAWTERRCGWQPGGAHTGRALQTGRNAQFKRSRSPAHSNLEMQLGPGCGPRCAGGTGEIVPGLLRVRAACMHAFIPRSQRCPYHAHHVQRIADGQAEQAKGGCGAGGMCGRARHERRAGGPRRLRRRRVCHPWRSVRRCAAALGHHPPPFFIAEPLLGHVTGGGGAAIVAHRHAWRHPASPSSTAPCSAAVAAPPRLEPGVQVEGSTCTVAVSCDSDD